MPCSRVRIGNATAIICGRKRIRACVKCGAIADRECDWKVAPGKTCDAAICSSCAVSPAPEKDLCPRHAEAWKIHPLNRGTAS
jgi:hypothetical protein